MKRRHWVLALAFAPLLAARPAAADVPEAVVADVPFKFLAMGGAHDPGQYELRVADNRKTIELIPSSNAGAGNKAGVEMVITRLGGPNTPENDRLVFDKVGDTYRLAEMWIAGEDGFLLYSTKEPHAHHAIPLHHKRK